MLSPQAWADGYVVDVDYTAGFYRELTPALLRFVTVLGGVQSVELDRPFTYVELGCGQGYSTTLLAAANPLGNFFGVDFNPTHVLNARRLAQEAQVGNVTFLEKSFAELLEVELPEADIITLHGVYSWINDENRGHILELIRRRLKPGGLAYISYNCLPGMAQAAPLQRLLRDQAERLGGAFHERVARALEFAGRLDAAGADYFRLSPLARGRLQSLARQDPRYVAHEYFNGNWSLFYHADVAAQVAAAKLTFVGSAALADNFDQLVLGPAMQQIVAEMGERVAAETLKDYARNQSFRRDVFSRGAPRCDGTELERRLGHTRFALARPRRGCRMSITTPAGEIAMHEAVYGPLLDALARGPLTFDQLAGMDEVAQGDRGRARQAVFAMAALGNILPALPAAGEEARSSAAARFNHASLARALSTPGPVALASPVLGSGIGLSPIDRILLDAPKSGDTLAWLRQRMRLGGHKLTRDGRPVESNDEVRAMLEERIGHFQRETQPWLRQLGIAA